MCVGIVAFHGKKDNIMSNEKFIRPHQPYSEAGEHNHTGMRSHKQRIAEAVDRLTAWRNGDDILPPITPEEANLLDTYPTDQEIVLMVHPDWIGAVRTERGGE